jgi:beta subunit of N-acylethanolamine-hydrolyzing acid amidase
VNIFDLKMANQSGFLDSETSISVHKIDLSLPPRDRYVALAKVYSPQIHRLTSLFDALLEDLGIPSQNHVWIKRAARILLYRLHSREETEEIQGIAKATGVSMYLLVSFNVILDLLMGCTSGAVRSLEPGQPLSQAKMLHFRTLDWGMDPLRSVIVQLDFIRSNSITPQKVLASSITYVGFVGVLTGVRKDLSMSLNFRGVHNARTRLGHFHFCLHHLLVLLGVRQSISSLLRSNLLGNLCGDGNVNSSTLTTVVSDIPSKRSTAAYLIFSDGKVTVTMEKDFRTAVLRHSRSFIVMTNHDLSLATDTGSDDSTRPELASLADVLSESTHRRKCIVDRWENKVRKAERRSKRDAKTAGQPNEAGTSLVRAGSWMRRSAKVRAGSKSNSRELKDAPDMTSIEDSVAVTTEEVISWVSAWPTTNECTHFAAVLDPTEGQVLWTQRYPTPTDDA